MHLRVRDLLELFLELESHVVNSKRHRSDRYDKRNDYQYTDTNYSTGNIITFSRLFILKISHLKSLLLCL
jgi:hypothetical protein